MTSTARGERVIGALPDGPPRHFCSEGVAARRGSGVAVEEDVVPAADLADRVQRLAHSGGGVALHQRDQRGPHADDGLLDRLGREHLAPRDLDRVHLGTAAGGDLLQQVPETAEDRHQHAVAGLQQRHQRRLDAGAGGAVDEEGLRVLRAEDGAVQLHRLVHGGGHERVELADQLRGHGPQHPRVDGDRARAHEQPGRHVQLGRGSRVHQAVLSSWRPHVRSGRSASTARPRTRVVVTRPGKESPS
jgi:hypothetical protein